MAITGLGWPASPQSSAGLAPWKGSKTYSSACIVSTLVFSAPNICCELLRDNCPVNVKLHRHMTYAAVIGSAVLFLFLVVCIVDTSPGCSCMHWLKLIKQLKGRRRLLLCNTPPAPNSVTTLALSDLTCPELAPPLIALCQAGGQGGPTKGPMSARNTRAERIRHVWEQRSK